MAFNEGLKFEGSLRKLHLSGSMRLEEIKKNSELISSKICVKMAESKWKYFNQS